MIEEVVETSPNEYLVCTDDSYLHYVYWTDEDVEKLIHPFVD